MKFWEWIIVGVAIAAILAINIAIIIVYHKKNREPAKNDEIIIKKKSKYNSLSGQLFVGYGFLSDKEYKYFKILQKAASELGYVALPKVELCDIIFCKNDDIKNNSSYHVKVDFCLFTDFEFRPVLIIDLFDNSFSDCSLLEMDEFTNAAIETVYLPVLKQATQTIYTHTEIKQQIMDAISRGSVTRDPDGF